MGVSSPFEQMILTKSSQLGKVCKELITLDIFKPLSWLYQLNKNKKNTQ